MCVCVCVCVCVCDGPIPTSCPLWNQVTLGVGKPFMLHVRVTMVPLTTSSAGSASNDRNLGESVDKRERERERVLVVGMC